MERYIIIHYAEIGLKGKNRPFFENTLIKNIRKKLANYNLIYAKNLYGRVLVKVEFNGTQGIKDILRRIPGIKYFTFVQICEPNIDVISRKASQILKTKKFKTFRVETKRANKDFLLNSQQINKKVGEYILNNISDIKVNLNNPDQTVYLELVNKYVFLYTNKIKGIGGLPVGVSGKALCLISSGIDSPVASYRMMKRGAQVFFVHFHSYPQTSKKSIQDVEDLVAKINTYQIESKLYLVPFLDFQKEVVEFGNVRDRVILYRRMMIRVAEMIAGREKINTLVTGESLGQVASQTMQNMYVISDACEKTQVFRPLLCYDKEEVIDEAKEIDTFEISSRGDEDCCSLFVPASPNTKASLTEIKEQEQNIDIAKYLHNISKSWEIKIIK